MTAPRAATFRYTFDMVETVWSSTSMEAARANKEHAILIWNGAASLYESVLFDLRRSRDRFTPDGLKIIRKVEAYHMQAMLRASCIIDDVKAAPHPDGGFPKDA